MRSTVTLTLKGGEQLVVTGYESNITEQVNAARAEENPPLLRLELDRIPTGQYAAVDPTEVVKIIGSHW